MMYSGFVLWVSVLLLNPTSLLAANTQDLYEKHCASCHGVDRLGRMGPALLPQNLKRLKKDKAVNVIRNGRAATQMPAFSNDLDDQQMQTLADYIYTPLKQIPHWGEAEINTSRRIIIPPAELSDKPVHDAELMNMFIVVELGDNHASILDGNSFSVIKRFKTHFALHGGPKYSPDGRYVYFASRDGWVAKYDMFNLKTVAEVRAGINTRNLAVSGDGQYVLVGNYLPHTLVLLKADDLSLVKIIPVVDDEGNSSRVSAVYSAPPRKSFVAALKDITEVWEIPYNADAEPIYPGLVHDYRLKEGIAVKGQFGIRRIKLDDYLDDFFFDQSYSLMIGAARNSKNGQVVHMDARRKIADVDIDGLPHLGSGITWDYKGRQVLASPNLKKSEISIIDMTTWKTIKRIKTMGPGFFMRSHENSRYAWAGVFFGPNRDAVHLIDKETLEIAHTLRHEKGKTAAHVEFDKDGKHALLSIWDNDGAVIVYDAKTLKEVKRLPMVKPSGKYNVYNKITRSAGTSH